MYTFIILAISLMFFIFSFLGKSVKIERNYFILSIIIFIILTLTFVLGVSIDIFNWHSKYFPKPFATDAARYIKEALMFREDIFEVNEINGTYYNYNVTPKFGLPSLIANLDIFFLTNQYVYYYLTFIVIYFLSLYNLIVFYKLIKLSSIKSYLLVALVFFLFFFPTDHYWNLRFFRESIANPLMVASCLSILASKYISKKYFAFLILFLLELTFFRAQLVILVIIFYGIAFITTKPHRKMEIIWMFGLLVFALKQSITAAGSSQYLVIFEILGLDFMQSLIQYFAIFEFNKILYFILIFISLGYFFIPIKNNIVEHKNIKLILLFSALLFGIAILLKVQIRFFYPIIILVKFNIFYYYFCKKYYNN